MNKLKIIIPSIYYLILVNVSLEIERPGLELTSISHTLKSESTIKS